MGDVRCEMREFGVSLNLFPSPWEGLGEGLRRVSVSCLGGSVNVDVNIQLFHLHFATRVDPTSKIRKLVRPQALNPPKERGNSAVPNQKTLVRLKEAGAWLSLTLGPSES